MFKNFFKKKKEMLKGVCKSIKNFKKDILKRFCNSEFVRIDETMGEKRSDQILGVILLAILLIGAILLMFIKGGVL